VSPAITALECSKPELTKRIHLPRGHLALLLGVGTAVPELRWNQDHIAELLAERWKLAGSSLDRWKRIIAGSGIGFRHGVVSPDEAMNLTTAQRMSLYEKHAGTLAEIAARQAMKSAGVEVEQITDLVVVSCTGFAAPGLDVELVVRLNLNRDVRRTMVGFMGCFGAISGLRTAVGACAADPGGCVLVVCAELCSLHMRAESDVQNQVASALFGDGAAAAVVQSRKSSGDREDGTTPSAVGIGRLTQGAARLIESARESMTWRITDRGFGMTLAREVPVIVRQSLVTFVDDACGGSRPRTFVVHPGGPGILEAVDEALDLRGDSGLAAARTVLRRVGNVSSGTVLFVLEELLRTDCELPAMLLAFGPGLTVESMMLI
jgi:predicted naringenin-chalcone synthase